jgi:hypothetical protein
VLSGFWDAVGGKLADKWASAASPAVVFWAGGLLAWAYAGRGLSLLARVAGWLSHHAVTVQVAALLGGLVVVLGSAIVVRRMTTPMLRVLEGYWPGWAARPRRALTGRLRTRMLADQASFQTLNTRRQALLGQLAGPGPAPGDAAAAQARAAAEAGLSEVQSALARLEMRAHHRPASADLMPTRTGNTLRAAETRPARKYGLDGVIVWPHLWLTMPDASRQELGSARAALDSAAAAVIWGLAFCFFTPLAWWALPAGAAVAVAAVVWWVPDRAEVFADLIDAAYDLHRAEVYKALRWPLPGTPAEELTAGPLITRYLWRGTPPPGGFTFTE